MTPSIDPSPLPVLPLSCGVPTFDSWPPIARMSAWSGIALGLFNLAEILVLLSMLLHFGRFNRLSPGWFKPMVGNQLLLTVVADAALSVLMIWGAAGCLRSVQNGRRLFLYATSGLSPMSIITIGILLVFDSGKSGFRVLPVEVVLNIVVVNLRDMLLPLLLWILMFKTRPKAI